jgi:hypothetical protein
VVAGNTPVLVHNINVFDANSVSCGVQAPLFILDDAEISSPQQIADSYPGGSTRVGQSAMRQDLLDDAGPGPYTYWRCGEQSPKPADMHMGHVNVPTSQGGNTDPENCLLEGAAYNLSAKDTGSAPPGKSCVERGGCEAPYGRSRDSYSDAEWGRY